MMSGNCSGDCTTCKIYYTGGCLAGPGDDDYVYAPPEWSVTADGGRKPRCKCSGPCKTCRFYHLPGGCPPGETDKYRYASPRWRKKCEVAKLRAGTAAYAAEAADAAVVATKLVAELAGARRRAADTLVQLLVGLPLDKPPSA